MGAERGKGGEKYSISEIYEHLFPGNLFQYLPVFSPYADAWATIKGLLGFDEFRKINFSHAIACGSERVELEDLNDSMLDKGAAARHYFHDLEPVARAEHPNFYNGRSFLDVLRPGERLGGVAKRKLSWEADEHLVNNAHDKSTYSLSMPNPEIVIGVLDENGEPSALIHMVEGNRVYSRRGQESPAVNLHPVRF